MERNGWTEGIPAGGENPGFLLFFFGILFVLFACLPNPFPGSSILKLDFFFKIKTTATTNIIIKTQKSFHKNKH